MFSLLLARLGCVDFLGFSLANWWMDWTHQKKALLNVVYCLFAC
jgi:hypothetical protein